MNIKIFSLIILTTLLLFSKNADASRTSIRADGPAYYNECYTQIEAQTVQDMTPVNTTKDQYQNSHDLIVQTISESLQSIGSNIGDQFTQLAIQLEVNYQNMTELRYNMLDDLAFDKMSFEQRKQELERYIEEAKFPVNFYNPNSIGVNVEKGTPEWNFFQHQCDQDKILNAANSDGTSNATNVAVNVTTNQDMLERERTTNPSSLMLDRRRNIAQSYCSQDDYESGLCETPSSFPNANLSASAFLSPSGEGEINKISPFKTRFTYSEAEEVISRDFMLTLMQPFNVASPRLNDIEGQSSQGFLSLYNNNIAALNLANYSFAIARENRIPTHKVRIESPEGDIFMPVGFFDNIRFINYQSSNDKTINTISSANNNKTILENIYKSNALNAKLNMEIYLQQERIERLEAAILSLSENSPELLRHLDVIR